MEVRGPGRERWTTRLRRGALQVAIADALVIAACAGLAALLGEFHRSAVGLLVLGAGGVAVLLGAVSTGALPLFTMGNAGSLAGVNYTNTLHAELLLQQEVRNPAMAADARRRRRVGARVALVGLSLVVLAFVIAG